jgi:hypothetical protein
MTDLSSLIERASFTPGPWDVCEIETSDGERYTSYGVCTADGSVIMDATNSSVGCIEWEHDGEPAGQVTRWDGAAEINARLIAAAPEMFEALARWVALAEGAIAEFGIEPHPDERAVLDQAKAALLRALSNGSKEGA